MSATTFPPQVEADLSAFYKKHNPSKVADIPTILREACKRGITEDEIFDSLCAKYSIKLLPDRAAVLARLAAAVPRAPAEDVRSALRRAELDGLAESDALRLLQPFKALPSTKSCGVAVPASSSGASSRAPVAVGDRPISGGGVFVDPAVPVPGRLVTSSSPDDSQGGAGGQKAPPGRARALTATVSRAKIDEVLCGELRDWLMEVLGSDFNAPVSAAASPNVVDSLRDGSVLTILGQKLRNPQIPKAEVKLPRSTQGFYARESVSKFLADAKKHFGLRPELLFTDADLCDRKSDRAVVNCLLAVAAAAFRSGAVAAAPAVVKFDKEIEEQALETSDDAVATAIALQEAMEGDGERGDDSIGSSDDGAASLNGQNEEKGSPDEADRGGRGGGGGCTEGGPHQLGGSSSVDTGGQGHGCKQLHEEGTTVATMGTLQLMTAGNRSAEAAGVSEGSCSLQQGDEALHQPQPGSYQQVAETGPGGGGLPPPHVATITDAEQERGLPSQAVANGGTNGASPSRSSPAPAAPAYRPVASDEVDKQVSTAVNALWKRHTKTNARIRRLAHQGQYVVYHRITGKRTVVYVRVVQKNLMIRVGGGWDVFSDWLARHLVECDNVMLPAGK